VRPRSAEDCAGLLARITATLGFLPFLVVEEDGRRESLLRYLLSPLPSPRAAAQVGEPVVGRLGDLVGAGMKLLGFNTNLAPILDLLTPFSEAVLGSRASGGDAQEVARCARAFVRGLAIHRVLACGKHFPGLGGGRLSAGFSLPVVDKTMAQLWRQDLVPYRELVGELPFVMLSHGVYKAYDLDVPRPAAASSGVVEGLLRVKLGYGGLAIADFRRPLSAGGPPDDGASGGSLVASAKSQHAGKTPTGGDGLGADLGDAAAQALIAGCDILLTTAEGAGKVLAGLRRALDLGRLSMRRVDQSLERVARVRRRLAPPSGKISKPVVDQLAERFQRFSRECQTDVK
jgi:beta-glucosidase-like glycosyl hydrolase